MRNCKKCGEPLTGRGANIAKLCVHCWVTLLDGVESGTWTGVEAAELFGVTPQAVSEKRMRVAAWRQSSSI